MKLSFVLSLVLLTALGTTGCKPPQPTPGPNSGPDTVADAGAVMTMCPNGVCKELAEEDKVVKPKNLGPNGFILNPEESNNLKKALAAGPVDHVDVGTGDNGNLNFKGDTSPTHTSNDATKVMVQTGTKAAPVQVKIVPTPAAAAAMHQRLATAQKP